MMRLDNPAANPTAYPNIIRGNTMDLVNRSNIHTKIVKITTTIPIPTANKGTKGSPNNTAVHPKNMVCSPFPNMKNNSNERHVSSPFTIAIFIEGYFPPNHSGNR